MRRTLALAGLVVAAAVVAPAAPASAHPQCDPYTDKPCFLICELLVGPYEVVPRLVAGAPEQC